MAALDDDKKDKRLSRLQPDVVKLLDCPVCYERVRPPVRVCHNGHAVCNNCRKRLLSCPTCKSSFCDNKNTVLDQIIEETIFACKYVQLGCSAEMKLHDIEKHEQKQCMYRTIVCTVAYPKSEPCNCGVSIHQYYTHVNTSHKSLLENIEFSLDTKRTIDVNSDLELVHILKDLKTSKMVFEVVKVDLMNGKFYITYVFIGTPDDANKYGYELRLLNSKEKYRELKYKSLCVPLGTTQTDMEESERCIILSTSIIPNFTYNGQLTYTIKFETVAKKWYKKVGRRLTHGLNDEDNAGSEG